MMAEPRGAREVRKFLKIVDIARDARLAIASPYPGTQRAQFDL
jgi:hypothetical protein